MGKEIKLAFEYYQAGMLQESRNICREILKVEPDNFDAIGLLGAVYYEAKDYQSAIVQFTRALRINPTNANVYYHLGLSLHEPATLDESIVNIEKLCSLNQNLMMCIIILVLH